LALGFAYVELQGHSSRRDGEIDPQLDCQILTTPWIRDSIAQKPESARMPARMRDCRFSELGCL
jgi:hypothetical protein